MKNYKTELCSWIELYSDAGYIPRLKLYEMRLLDIEKVVDYCYCMETCRDYEKYTSETNVGYGVTTEFEIKKIIRRYAIDDRINNRDIQRIL